MSFKYESIYFDEPIVSERVLDIFIPEEKTRDVAIFLCMAEDGKEARVQVLTN